MHKPHPSAYSSCHGDIMLEEWIIKSKYWLVTVTSSLPRKTDILPQGKNTLRIRTFFDSLFFSALFSLLSLRYFSQGVTCPPPNAVFLFTRSSAVDCRPKRKSLFGTAFEAFNVAICLRVPAHVCVHVSVCLFVCTWFPCDL